VLAGTNIRFCNSETILHVAQLTSPLLPEFENPCYYPCDNQRWNLPHFYSKDRIDSPGSQSKLASGFWESPPTHLAPPRRSPRVPSFLEVEEQYPQASAFARVSSERAPVFISRASQLALRCIIRDAIYLGLLTFTLDTCTWTRT
jgi:hypothetical protein